MARITTLALLLVAALASSAYAAPQRPNILIFLIDDVGWGDLGPYGGPIKVPAIGRLAREGMRFTDFHASSICSPTRAMLLTGRYNQRMAAGALDWALKHLSDDGLPASEVTIAEMLKGAYRTRAIVGKWHLGRLPQFNPVNNGFTFFYGLLEADATYTTHVGGPWGRDWWINLAPNAANEYTTFATTREALRQIDTAGNDAFFIYVAYQAPHWPIALPGNDERDNFAVRPQVIKLVDDSIGQIMNRVRSLSRPTFVLFLSDNGSGVATNNRPLRGGKGTVYEGGIRVPAIAWWPGRVPPGVSSETLHVLDVLPTVAELTGVALPARPLDGKSFARLFAGGRMPARRLFWDLKGNGAVRDGAWKLVKIGGNAPQLYDLASDIEERTNVATANPQRVTALVAALEQWRSAVRQ
jgi:arylsulfatase A-like enzyme